MSPGHLVSPHRQPRHQTLLGRHHPGLELTGGLDLHQLPPLHQSGLHHGLEQDPSDPPGAGPGPRW